MMAHRWARGLVLAALAVAACDYPRPPPVGDVDAQADATADPDAATIDADTGDGGGDVDAPAADAGPDAMTDARLIDAIPVDAPGTITVTMAPPTLSSRLGTTNHYTVTVTSMGYAGSVALGSSGGPADWTRNLPAAVTLAVGQSMDVGFDVIVASDGSAAAGAGATVTVSGTIAGMPARTASSMLAIENRFVIAMAFGTGTNAHWGPIANTTVQLRNGSTFEIRNDDVDAHQIHTGGGVAGLIHQAAAMQPTQSYTAVLGSIGTDTIYCHAHGQGTGQFNVNVH